MTRLGRLRQNPHPLKSRLGPDPGGANGLHTADPEKWRWRARNPRTVRATEIIVVFRGETEEDIRRNLAIDAEEVRPRSCSLLSPAREQSCGDGDRLVPHDVIQSVSIGW